MILFCTIGLSFPLTEDISFFNFFTMSWIELFTQENFNLCWRGKCKNWGLLQFIKHTRVLLINRSCPSLRYTDDLAVGPTLEGLSLVEFTLRHLPITIIALGTASRFTDFHSNVLSLLESACSSHCYHQILWIGENLSAIHHLGSWASAILRKTLLKNYLFIHLLLAALEFCCLMWGLLFVAGHGL